MWWFQVICHPHIHWRIFPSRLHKFAEKSQHLLNTPTHYFFVISHSIPLCPCSGWSPPFWMNSGHVFTNLLRLRMFKGQGASMRRLVFGSCNHPRGSWSAEISHSTDYLRYLHVSRPVKNATTGTTYAESFRILIVWGIFPHGDLSKH